MNLLTLSQSIITHCRVAKLQSRGQNLGRHIIVFESDDWGSIRMPSLRVRQSLLERGVLLQSPDTYDRLDTLASENDLTALAEVLSGVNDKDGNPAIITLNTVTANPDFKRIKESNFEEYYYEPFVETLKRYPHHAHSFELWEEGIEKGVFRPQFHAREHLNAQRWLRCLRAGDKGALYAFEEETYVALSMVNGSRQRVLDAYNADIEGDYPFMQKAVKEGLDLFEKIFGFKSSSMIAPCYTWDDPIEEEAARCGVTVLQGNVFQSHSAFYSQSHPHQTPRIMGEKNGLDQTYLVRNCMFEPVGGNKYNMDRCLKDIKRQFDLGHPAVVSCHRQNFIGDLVPQNRDNTLRQLKHLLKTVVTKWPDVEFMSSDQLGIYLSSYGGD